MEAKRVYFVQTRAFLVVKTNKKNNGTLFDETK
jgi:hypothetical protein